MGARFRLLGEFEAYVDDEPIDIGHSRQRGVLAVLLAEANQIVPTDRLITRIWGDSPPHQARNTLYGYLHRLRHALAHVPDMTIDRRSNGYVATIAPDAVDIHRFAALTTRARATVGEQQRRELLEEALALWQGEPFVGLDVPWLAGLAGALVRQRLAAELDHTDLALKAGRHNELLGSLSERVNEHPLDERLAGQYMLALYRSGQAATALNHYELTRRSLADQLGIDPNESLRQLYLQILSAAPELLSPCSDADAAPAPVPRQLPSPPRAFAGRTEELAQLDKAVADSGDRRPVVITAIGGAGGVGKTWLALHWAHSVANRFPDGQLYANLRGFDPAASPMRPVEALRIFLCGLGIEPKAIPVGIDAQAGLYRSLVADKQILVLLDNAHDAAQVVPLLPGSSTCAVVITSRSRLAGLMLAHGAQPLALNVLAPGEAGDLLSERLDARRLADEPDAVTEIIGHCGGMPLALGIVACRAALHPGTPLATFAAELRETTTRLGALDYGDADTSVQAVLSSSYRALTHEQARVFRLLGLVPGPDISLAAAAAVSGLPESRTAQIMSTLEDASLVALHLPGRYRMHDLIRLYARQQAMDDEPPTRREAALRQLTDFYLRTSNAADRLLDPHSPPVALPTTAPIGPELRLANESEAMAWLDAEHSCLLAVQKTAADHGWHDTVWQLAWGLTTFHLRRGHLRDDVAVWCAALTAARQLEDPHTEALAHRMVGDTYSRIGDHKSALDHLRQALALAEQAGDTPGEAHAHTTLSHAWAEQNDEKKALRHAALALPLYRELGNAVWEARTLNQMGRLSARLGDSEKGKAHCISALILSRNNKDRHGEAAALSSLAHMAKLADQTTESIEYYEKALALYRDLGDSYKEAETHDLIGQACTDIGDLDSAVAHWVKAYDFYRAQHRDADAIRVQRQLKRAADPSTT